LDLLTALGTASLARLRPEALRRGGERVHGRGGPLTALASEAPARASERRRRAHGRRGRGAEDGQRAAPERPLTTSRRR
jgi:hypothetical protein